MKFSFVILATFFFFQNPQALAVPHESSTIAIAGPSQLATDAGERVARQGGNVVDVAVTTALTLSVTSPYYAALGGGGFSLVHINGKTEVLDFREVAPKKMGPESYKKMVSIWCAKDRQTAMTDAKARRKVEEATCNNPIESQYKLGQKLGVNGTPALILSNGELVPGYLPAKRLISILEKKD